MVDLFNNHTMWEHDPVGLYVVGITFNMGIFGIVAKREENNFGKKTHILVHIGLGNKMPVFSLTYTRPV